VEPDAVEIRVVACLVEKQRTTPDQYPLTLNSLRLACNQSTNREPIVDYDDATIRSALDRLTRRKWATLASWRTARSVKYKHLFDQALGLSDPQLALMTVLMLRGEQTPGELRPRAERIYRFSSGDEVEQTLDGLMDRGLCARLPRRPGERGQRFRQLLSESGDEELVAPPPAIPMEAPPAVPMEAPASSDGIEARVEALESEMAALRGDLARLREELGAEG
jgi:uncharacterized protein